MAQNIIPQEDNTSEILKDDLLKYSYINRRNRIKKTRFKANAADQQERAIRLLKEERRLLEIKLKAITSNINAKEGENYRAKFAELICDVKKSEVEYNVEKKIEVEIDKEIRRLEIALSKPGKKIEMKTGKIVTGDVNIEYNKLINEQNQLRVKVESSLKRLQPLQMIYNSLMNKLEKGQKLSLVLSEQVTRIQKQRNNAKEHLKVHLKFNNIQIQSEDNNITLLRRQLFEDTTLTEYLSEKLKKRESKKKTERSNDENTVLSALNAEAKTFIKYLIHIADENNLEKIMETIVKMDLDNKCMYEFLLALDIHLTEAETAIEQSRTSAADRARVVSDMHAAKTQQLAGLKLAHKSGCAVLREACRASRLMAAEWRRMCRAVDDVRDLMMDGAGETLDRGCGVGGGSGGGGPVIVDASTGANDGEADAADSYEHRRPPIVVAELVAYFGPVERRLDEVLYRVFWTQDNVGRGDGGDGDDDDGGGGGAVGQQRRKRRRRPRPRRQKPPDEVQYAVEDAVAGESMSTGSEQGDDFVAQDLDGYNNRQAKILAATDPNAVELDFVPIDAGQVPSLCPECLEKRFEDNNERVMSHRNKITTAAADRDENGTRTKVMCTRENVSLKNVHDKQYEMYFHRTVDCPGYTIEKFHN